MEDDGSALCMDCGEPFIEPNVEDYEEFGKLLCEDCAQAWFEDAYVNSEASRADRAYGDRRDD